VYGRTSAATKQSLARDLRRSAMPEGRRAVAMPAHVAVPVLAHKILSRSKSDLLFYQLVAG
jgi:hypothetical protein